MFTVLLSFYQHIQASTDAPELKRKVVDELQAALIFAKLYDEPIELNFVKAELQLNDYEWIKSALDVVAKKIKELVAFESELNADQRKQLYACIGIPGYKILYNLYKNQADSAQVQSDVKAFTEAIDKIKSELASNETVAANPNTNATQVTQQID